jgi:micrococcal nuclease
MRGIFYICGVVLTTQWAYAAEVLPGPIPAEVVRVVDGDTLEVRARIWLGQDMTVRVRLAGVNTPEKRSRCEEEKALAEKARAFVTERIGQGVVLRNIHYGKWAGRVVAQVDAGNRNLSDQLIAAGLGRAYNGGKRVAWCDQ